MVATKGLVGLRPDPRHVARVTAPPYDVIKPGSALEKLLDQRRESIFHVTLGDAPAQYLEALLADSFLVEDVEPAYYVYEQTWEGGSRTGVLVAGAVSPYAERQIIRHEKTFDDKVRGRVELGRATRHTIGPVFLLTRAPIGALLEEAKALAPVYDFVTELGGLNDLHGIRSRVFRVLEASALGARLREALASEPLYIADGHHRYHAALLERHTHFLAYVTEGARILAYDRVAKGVRSFASVAPTLPLRPATEFATPPKRSFCIYTREGTYLLDAQHVPADVVGRLDCSVLERELYPRLGLTHAMIPDRKHFDYYPESALEEMKAAVDRGDYDLAIALHPVTLDELMAVADAGLEDPDVVMPEKSTFFSPKILSGLFVYRHTQLPPP